MEEWSFAKSSLPGIGRDKSWKVSTVVETCHRFKRISLHSMVTSEGSKASLESYEMNAYLNKSVSVVSDLNEFTCLNKCKDVFLFIPII